MFGHLKPEQFISVIEGESLDQYGLAHLESCAVCMAQVRSMQAVHRDLATDDGIPEPDWNSFRDSVRLELLSRSVQREATVRRWTGWPIRPAMAWSLSFALLIGVSVGGFLWHVSHDVNRPTSGVTQQTPIDTPDLEELAGWTGAGVFQELSTLKEPQVERLRQLVESAQNGSVNRQ